MEKVYVILQMTNLGGESIFGVAFSIEDADQAIQDYASDYSLRALGDGNGLYLIVEDVAPRVITFQDAVEDGLWESEMQIIEATLFKGNSPKLFEMEMAVQEKREEAPEQGVPLRELFEYGYNALYYKWDYIGCDIETFDEECGLTLDTLVLYSEGTDDDGYTIAHVRKVDEEEE